MTLFDEIQAGRDLANPGTPGNTVLDFIIEADGVCICMGAGWWTDLYGWGPYQVVLHGKTTYDGRNWMIMEGSKLRANIGTLDEEEAAIHKEALEIKRMDKARYMEQLAAYGSKLEPAFQAAFAQVQHAATTLKELSIAEAAAYLSETRSVGILVIESPEDVISVLAFDAVGGHAVEGESHWLESIGITWNGMIDTVSVAEYVEQNKTKQPHDGSNVVSCEQITASGSLRAIAQNRLTSKV